MIRTIYYYEYLCQTTEKVMHFSFCAPFFLPGISLGAKVMPRHAPVLLEYDILAAHKQTPSCVKAAEYLGVSYNTYKKYAKLYGIFDSQKNQGTNGLPRGPYNGTPIEEILEGKHPKHIPWPDLLRRCVRWGYLADECNNCGISESRITDQKKPLKLDHIDGDLTNHRLENLRALCYNCYFLMVG